MELITTNHDQANFVQSVLLFTDGIANSGITDINLILDKVKSSLKQQTRLGQENVVQKCSTSTPRRQLPPHSYQTPLNAPDSMPTPPATSSPEERPGFGIPHPKRFAYDSSDTPTLPSSNYQPPSSNNQELCPNSKVFYCVFLFLCQSIIFFLFTIIFGSVNRAIVSFAFI